MDHLSLLKTTSNVIAADTSSYEQYIRNLAAGGATANLSVVLVDAHHGVVTETRQHSIILATLGIRQVILAVDNMDLVDFDPSIFEVIRDNYLNFAKNTGLEQITAIPISSLKDENVTTAGASMPWHDGPTLKTALDKVANINPMQSLPFRFPVQNSTSANDKNQKYSGTVVAGQISVGDDIAAIPGGLASQVREITTTDGAKQSARLGAAVTIGLRDKLNLASEVIICPANQRPQVTDQVQANLIWLHQDEMLPGRSYLLQSTNSNLPATITDLRYRISSNSLENEATKVLQINDVGVCNLNLARPIAFDPYLDNPATGSFILIDRLSNATVAVGMINFGLRRATNIHWQSVEIEKNTRASQKHQRPCVLWFTGLSGSGKSTIANILDQKLHARGKHTYLLDGDNVRHGLNKDLGFTDADRVENIRRIGEVAKLMADAGLVTLVSFISPFRAERRMAREMVGEGEFLEIYIDTPLAVCEERDPKGLYERARRGEIKNFTGLDSPYEVPETAEIILDTTQLDPEASADKIISSLEAMGYLPQDSE